MRRPSAPGPPRQRRRRGGNLIPDRDRVRADRRLHAAAGDVRRPGQRRRRRRPVPVRQSQGRLRRHAHGPDAARGRGLGRHRAALGEITALQVPDLTLDGPEPCLRVRRAWKRNPPPTSEFHRPDTCRVSSDRPRPANPGAGSPSRPCTAGGPRPRATSRSPPTSSQPWPPSGLWAPTSPVRWPGSTGVDHHHPYPIRLDERLLPIAYNRGRCCACWGARSIGFSTLQHAGGPRRRPSPGGGCATS